MQLRKSAVLWFFIYCFGFFSVFASVDGPSVSLKTVGIIKRFEGFRAAVYDDCAGHKTIGYGHLITRSDGDLASRVLSESEGQTLLMTDIQTKANILPNVSVSLSQNQFDALTSLCFNIGTKAFSGSDVLKRVNAGEIIEAYEYFGHWRRAGGEIVDGLMKRRFAELFIFADNILNPEDDRAPSIQWGTAPMEITDGNWTRLRKRPGLLREAVEIYQAYKAT
ncbi:MAG: lysozyme [Alphaproteobacteria bacterium]|nr:lysozyme [Alphaproteobacteria bacterium]